MTDLTTPFCPECGHVKHVAGCPETRLMTDLEALAKLATEATPGPWVGCGDYIEAASITHRGQDTIVATFEPDAEGRTDAAYIAAASPDVVLALVRVVQAARIVGQWADNIAEWAVPPPLNAELRDLNAALADLDR